MDPSGSRTSCKNSASGCTFGTSSVVEMAKHFQRDCAFHPVRCFKCNTTVGKVNFEMHYTGYCKDNPAPPCPAPEEVLDFGIAEAIRIMSREQHLLRDCVRECTQGLESVSQIMRAVAADVSELKGLKAKQEDLEIVVKRQFNVTENSHKAIAEKVNSVQGSVNELVTRLENDAGTTLQRVEKLDGLIREVRVLARPLEDQSRIHWYVEYINQYIKGGEVVTIVKSDVFVVRGYSLRLVFELEKRKTNHSMGIFIRLCRGPKDSLLQWPFRIPFTLSLIHPKDASKTKEYDKHPVSSGSPEKFAKPNSEENTGTGTASLCTVQEARREGFIENDALCFAFTLHE